MLSRTVSDAIVLDVDMPQMDGLNFLRKLMRQHPLPVLLCTDHVRRGLAGLEMGACEVIPKTDWNNARDLAPWAARLRESLRIATDSTSASAPAFGPVPTLTPSPSRPRPTTRRGVGPSLDRAPTRSFPGGPTSPAARRASGSS